jgi:nicotinamide mononucleotide transporter
MKFVWILNHYIELIGAVSGIIYLYFSIKQKIWLWPWGIVTSAFYVIVFFNEKLYADMSLNAYYVIISFYGWYNWKYGKNIKNNVLPITKLNKKQWIITLFSIIILWVIIKHILNFLSKLTILTLSEVALWDAFITASSIVATYLLAIKKIEQWLFWIFIDAISIILFIYKGLYPTVVLFIFYALLAISGYFEWKKELIKIKES